LELQKINLNKSLFSNRRRSLLKFFENRKISGLLKANCEVKSLSIEELVPNNFPAAEHHWLGSERALDGIVSCPLNPAVLPWTILYTPATVEACP
jgi:hypothetical protein